MFELGVRLVEQTEAHVLVGLLGGLLLLLLLGSVGGGSTTGGSGATGSGTTSTAARNGGELGRSLGDQLLLRKRPRLAILLFLICKSLEFFIDAFRSYLVNVLALELRDELLEALLIGLDTDGVEDLLDVGGRGRGVAAEAEEQVSRKVLHFDGVFYSVIDALVSLSARPQIFV